MQFKENDIENILKAFIYYSSLKDLKDIKDLGFKKFLTHPLKKF